MWPTAPFRYPTFVHRLAGAINGQVRFHVTLHVVTLRVGVPDAGRDAVAVGALAAAENPPATDFEAGAGFGAIVGGISR
mgnify:CR=1 FL=1